MKWLAVNKLSLNIEKTNIMIFDNVDTCDTIHLGSNLVIKECKTIKYLGLMVIRLV